MFWFKAGSVDGIEVPLDDPFYFVSVEMSGMWGTYGGVVVEILNRGGSGANAGGDGNWV